jgi:hypothetical protein
LVVTTFPTTNISPGSLAVLAAHIEGTADQIAAVPTVSWTVAYHAGSVPGSTCPEFDSSKQGTCLGMIATPGSFSGTFLTSFPENGYFLAGYGAYKDAAIDGCLGQPSAGLDVDVTAYTTSTPPLISTTTMHVNCSPAIGVTPGPMSLRPASTGMTFHASTDGSDYSSHVSWSLNTLSGAPASPINYGSINSITGAYVPPLVAPTGSPLVMVVARSLLNPAVQGATWLTITNTPVSVAITAPTSYVIPGGNIQFTAAVDHLTSLGGDPSVTWTLEPATGTTSSTHVHFDTDTPHHPGRVVVDSGSSPYGDYIITATSAADQTKSAHKTFHVVATTPTATLTVTPTYGSGSPLVLDPGETQQLTPTLATDPHDDVGIVWSGVTTPSSVSASGLFTAGAVATDLTAYTVVATDTPSSATGSTHISVHAVGVSLTPSSISIPIGGSATFTATVTHASHLTVPTGMSTSDVTWQLDHGSTMDVHCSPTVTTCFDPTTRTFHVAPTDAGGTSYTLTATSVADTSKSQSVTLTIPADPQGVGGTISYMGIKDPARLFVSCVDATGDTGPGLYSGTVTIDPPTDWPPASLPYRIRGGNCGTGSTVTAWLDTLGTGRFVFGSDPVGSATVASGSRTANITLHDYLGATPPSMMTAPTIDRVIPEPTGAVVVFTPYVDGSAPPREFATFYDIHYSAYTTSSPMLDLSHEHILTVRPGTNMAFISGLAPGNYAFAIQARFTSVGGTTTVAPATLAVASTHVPAASPDLTINGAVSMAGVPSAGGTLHTLAYRTGPLQSAPTAAGSASLDGGLPTSDFSVSGEWGDGGTLAVLFLGDHDSDGTHRPDDIISPFVDPLHYLESLTSAAVPAIATDYSLPFTTGSVISVEDAIEISNGAADVRILTDVDLTAGTSAIRYLVTSGYLPVLQVTRNNPAPIAWESSSDTVRDLYCDTMMAPRGTWTNSFYATFPLSGDPSIGSPVPSVSFTLRRSGGSEQTAPVSSSDYLDDGLVFTAPSTLETPEYSWTAPTCAMGNSIDHYILTIKHSGTLLETRVIASIGGAPAATSVAGAERLTGGATYSYEVVAVDGFGNRVRINGTFASESE